MNYKITCKSGLHGFRNVAGLGSDIVHGIIPSMIWLSDSNISNYTIDWYNPLYQNSNYNLYDKLFTTNKYFESYDAEIKMDNCPYGIYFSREITHEQFQRGSEITKLLNIEESNFIKKFKLPFSTNEKVLGVQQRKTDHISHVLAGDMKLFSDNDLIKLTEEEFKRNTYDKIFLITDDNDTLNLFKNNFGDTLLYNDCQRSVGNIGVHFSNVNFDRLILAEQMIIDSYSLSKTKYKLICNSNVSTLSMLLNYERDNYFYIDR
jgi:hypothetical protein